METKRLNFKKQYCANYLYDGDKNCKKQCFECEIQDLRNNLKLGGNINNG